MKTRRFVTLPDDVLARIASLLDVRDVFGAFANTCRGLYRAAHAMESIHSLTAACAITTTTAFWDTYKRRIERISIRDARHLPPISSPLLVSLSVTGSAPPPVPMFDGEVSSLKTLKLPSPLRSKDDVKAIPWKTLEDFDVSDCKALDGATMFRDITSMNGSWASLKRMRCSSPDSVTLATVCTVVCPSLTNLLIDHLFDVSRPNFWTAMHTAFPMLSDLTLVACLVRDSHITGPGPWAHTLTALTIVDVPQLTDTCVRVFLQHLRRLSVLTLYSTKISARQLVALLLHPTACPNLTELRVDTVTSALICARRDVRIRRPLLCVTEFSKTT